MKRRETAKVTLIWFGMCLLFMLLVLGVFVAASLLGQATS